MLSSVIRAMLNKGGLSVIARKTNLGDIINQAPGMICVSLPRTAIDGVYREVGRIPDNSFITRIFLWGAGAGAKSSGTGPDVFVKVGAMDSGGADVQLFTGNMETLNWGEITGANGGFAGAMSDLVTDGRISMKFSGTDWNAAGEADVRVWIEFACNEDT